MAIAWNRLPGAAFRKPEQREAREPAEQARQTCEAQTEIAIKNTKQKR
jgi:hypothetical protein